jgi:signal transduction histidine kinase
VHRHANASRVEVRVAESGGVLTVEVEDNGRGFPAGVVDASGMPARVGVGLGGIRERARYLHGELHIESNAQGTVLKLTVPTNEQN